MEFSLIDNGTDSLKKAKVSIEKFEELHENYAYHHLKDAIIFLNHGIEILLKYILSKRNESLIFTDLKLYIEAKKQLKKNPDYKEGFGIHLEKSKQNVFDVSIRKLKGKKLTTITLLEALERVEFLCDITPTEDFKNAIFLINNYRNHLTHHSINLTKKDEEKLIQTLKALYGYTLDFFEEHISGLMQKVDSQRFELTVKEWEQIQQDMADFYYERAMSDLSEEDLY